MLQPILRPMDNPKTSTFPPFPQEKEPYKKENKRETEKSESSKDEENNNKINK